MFFVNNTMILVQCYVGSFIDDDMTRLFNDCDADYAQQYAEVSEEVPNVDYVSVKTLEVV